MNKQATSFWQLWLTSGVYVSLLLIYSPFSNATACGAIFADALQTHAAAPNGKITFKSSARIINNPDTILNTASIENPSGNAAKTCGTVHCQASGQLANTLDVGNFQYNENGQNLTINQGSNATIGAAGTTDYAAITVGQGSTTTFVAQQAETTVYRLQRLDLGQGNTLNLVPGDYWIEDFLVGQGSTINVIGTGTARLLLLNSATINQGSMNNSGEQNAAKKLFIYSYSDFTINQGNTFKGFIYAQGNVLVHQGNTLTGAINAKNITLNQSTTITYDSNATATLDLNQACNFTPSISHFVIQHDGNGNCCIPENITVSAYNGTNLVTNFDGEIKLNTTTGKGTWSLLAGHGALVDATPDNGIAYYTFDPEDKGQVSFELLYTNGAPSMNLAMALRYNGDVHDDDSEGLLTFIGNGFLLTGAPLPTPTPAINQITRYSTTQIAGLTTPIYITAYGARADNSCGKIDGYTGAKAIKFWQSYLNPLTGTLTTLVNNTAVGATSQQPITVNLTFTAGASNFQAMYRDVGMLKLTATDDTDPANKFAGSTDNYVVKPARLAITNINSNGTPNPAAQDATGGIFTKAGEQFTVEVAVQDNDGNATPNFGRELEPARLKLVPSLVAPMNGELPDLGYNTSYTMLTPGVFRFSEVFFDEVGIIKLAAIVTNENYLGTGTIPGPLSANVGRFIPDHFAAELTTVPIFNSGCASGFTYLGQPFTYGIEPNIQVTAKSKANNTTQNYRDLFWKLAASDLTVTYNANSQVAALDSTNARAAKTVAPATNGTGLIVLGDGGGLKFNKQTGSNLPGFNAEIQANVHIQDPDGVVYATNTINNGIFVIDDTQPNTGINFSHGKTMYQGRLSLANNFGSEITPLMLTATLQYFNGTDYVTNALDNCTLFPNANIITLQSHPVTLTTTPSFGIFQNGVGTISLSAPNIAGDVDITVDLSAATGANMPYLQHDWPQDGSDGLFDDNPVAKGTFGIYHGNDKAIYTKEVLE